LGSVVGGEKAEQEEIGRHGRAFAAVSSQVGPDRSVDLSKKDRERDKGGSSVTVLPIAGKEKKKCERVGEDKKLAERTQQLEMLFGALRILLRLR